MNSDLLVYVPGFLHASWLVFSITVLVIVVSWICGLAAALGKTSSFAPVRWLSTFYIWFIRGTPTLIQVFIVYIGFPQLGLKLSPFVAGVLALGVNSGASFEYRIFGTVGYNWGPANISLQWQHIPATEDGAEVFFLNGQAPEGTDNSGIPAYNLFNLNAGYQVNDNLRLRAGIDNLFGKRPPITGIDVDTDPSLGQLPQGGFSLFHDVLGRRFSLGANIRF